MNECKKVKALLTDALFDELEAVDQDLFKAHVRDCPACTARFAPLNDTLSVMKKQERQEPGEEFWAEFWPQLSLKVEREKKQQRDLTHKNTVRSKLWVGVPKWVFQTAAAILLVTVGIFIGRSLYFPKKARTGSGPLYAQKTEDIQRHEDLIRRAGNYIDKSKLILVALVNFDSREEDPFSLNMPFQKKISQDLVREVSLLKSDLEDAKQKQLLELVSDLELILLHIANLEEEVDTDAIEIVRDGVDRNGILMKIDLFDMRKTALGSIRPLSGSTASRQQKF
ncbi:zf-HC2 domain-containing protein [Acidobacteriota bacterium]